MANRTQLRIGQITGSFDAGPGGIVDNQDADSAANIGDITLSSGSMVGILSELASAIKRINGGNTFAALDAGEIAQNISIIGTNPKLTIGDAGTEDTVLVFDANAGDLHIGVDHDDGNLHFGAGGTAGTNTNMVIPRTNRNVIFKNDITVEGNDIDFNAGNATIGASVGANNLTLGGAATTVVVAGTAIDVDSASALTIGATVGANELTLGAGTSTVVIPGTMIVQGTTTTVSSSNLVIQDPILGLGVSGSDGPADWSNVGDRGLIFARGTATARLPGFWWDGTNFTLAKSATAPNSGSFGTIVTGEYSTLEVGDVDPGESNTYALGSTSLMWSDLFLGDGGVINFNNGNVSLTHSNNQLLLSSGDALAFGDAGEKITGDGSNLTVASSQDLTLDVERDIILDTNGDNVTIKNNGTTFGNIKAATNSLVLSGGNGTGKGIFIDSHAGTVTFREGSTSSVIGVLEANSAGLLLSASAEKGGTLTLDANDGNINLAKQGTLLGQIIDLTDSAGMVISSSLSNDLVLDSSSGIINFALNNGTTTRGAIDLNEANVLTFGLFNAAAPSFDVGFLELKKTARTVLSASSGFDIDTGADAAELRLIATGTFGDFVGLKSPATLPDGSITFTLPSADASSSGQALVSNGSGTLSFSAVGGAATKKGVRIIGAAGIASGSAVSMATANLAEGSQPGTLISTAYDRVDVFVNGLLMMSGTDANVGTGVRDYTVSASRTIKFGFDLEADDIVTIIEK